jgi:Fe-S-cluster containining protein
LFDRVPLSDDDALIPLELGGIQLRTGGTAAHFLQPCAAFREGQCRVYADRPANCRKYRCLLLREYDSGAVTWDEAQQRIRRVRMLKETLGPELEIILIGG